VLFTTSKRERHKELRNNLPARMDARCPEVRERPGLVLLWYAGFLMEKFLTKPRYLPFPPFPFTPSLPPSIPPSLSLSKSLSHALFGWVPCRT
jgi:hypothetical protein